MAGEAIAKHSHFNRSSYNLIGYDLYSSKVYKYRIGHAGYMRGKGRDSFWTNDDFNMRVYYASGGWVESARAKVTGDGTTKYLYCFSSHSYRARWRYLWDPTPYGDGKAYFDGACYTRTAGGGDYGHLLTDIKVRLFSNFGGCSSTTTPSPLNNTLITTARYVGRF